jgi:hypothetical protein
MTVSSSCAAERPLYSLPLPLPLPLPFCPSRWESASSSVGCPTRTRLCGRGGLRAPIKRGPTARHIPAWPKAQVTPPHAPRANGPTYTQEGRRPPPNRGTAILRQPQPTAPPAHNPNHSSSRPKHDSLIVMRSGETPVFLRSWPPPLPSPSPSPSPLPLPCLRPCPYPSSVIPSGNLLRPPPLPLHLR